MERDSFGAGLLEDILRRGRGGGCKGQGARGKGSSFELHPFTMCVRETKGEERGGERGA